MIDQLRRLAEIDPELCRVRCEEMGETRISIYHLDCFRMVAYFQERKPELFKGAEDIIQVALQAAIERRGWDFELVYWPLRKRYACEVQDKRATADSAAAAMLAAYIKALEA